MSPAVGVRNAFNEDYTHMRRSLANRLLENISINRKYSDTLKFFEIGKIYSKIGVMSQSNQALLSAQSSKPFSERKIFAGVATGSTIEALRQDMEVFLRNTLGFIPPLHANNQALPFLHPGISGEYREGDLVIGRFGRIHPMTAESYDIPNDTLYFEIEYEALLTLQSDKEILFYPISKYQTVSRELNFILDEHVQTGEVARAINAVHPWIGNVVVDSVYRDDAKIGNNKKSVNFSFTLTNLDDTISDEDAMTVQNAIIDKMRRQGFELRQ